MSIAMTSKLKYPYPAENFEFEKPVKAAENISLLKQIQNLKLNKYSKYFVNLGKAKNDRVLLDKKLNYEKKQSLMPSGRSLRNMNKDKSTTRKGSKDTSEDLTIILDADASLNAIYRGANSSYNVISNNYVTEPAHSTNKNLEVILELETQRTEEAKSPILTSDRKIFTNLNNEITQINPQYSSDYMMDIYENLLLEELNSRLMFGYMKSQTDINEKMRAILVDWIINVHYKFKLSPETLFLCVNLIDKYLSIKIIKREKLQLIGVTALLIACKYEEIFSPELRDFEYITDKSYTKEEIIEIEIEMLVEIFKFDITIPSSYRFYEIISTKIKFTPQEYSLGRYLLELFLVDYRYTKFLPSQIALSVCFLVVSFYNNSNLNCNNNILEKDNHFQTSWNFNNTNSSSCLSLKDFLEIELKQNENFMFYDHILKECCKDICFILQNIESTQLLNVKKKFTNPEHYKVGTFNIIL